MNLISREKLRQFDLFELIEYQECMYHGIHSDTIKNNKFNKYLLKHNLLVMEDHLDEVIDEKLKEYNKDIERICNND
jgi:hypothetical protein